MELCNCQQVEEALQAGPEAISQITGVPTSVVVLGVQWILWQSARGDNFLILQTLIWD